MGNRNPYNPSVYKIGFIGEGKHLSGVGKKHTRVYDTWNGILRRCYSKKSSVQNPTYVGCTISKDWCNFQIFAEWYEENYVEGWQLDKDILVKGNKIYSPETCCFVPQEINKLILKRDKLRGDYPIGVNIVGSRFVARLNRGKSKSEYLGYHNTPEEAFQAYKIAKEKRIKEAAEKYKPQITEACYQALINYRVEITD